MLLFNTLILTRGPKGLTMGVVLLGPISGRVWIGYMRGWIGFMFLEMTSSFSGRRPIDVLIKATRLDHLPI
jgi:hypothetical protein